MSISPYRPMGLLRFTDKDGDRVAVDCCSVSHFSEEGEGIISINFFGGNWLESKESFEDLTGRYEAIVRGKPGVTVIEGDSEERP